MSIPNAVGKCSGIASYTDRGCAPAPRSGYSRAIEGDRDRLLPCYRTQRGGGGRMGDWQGEGATRKGPWQSMLHSPFFRGRMFWEERVCWQPDPPSGCGDLQRRGCWQLTSPLLLLGFFPPFTLQIPPPTDLLISSFFLPQHKFSHIQVPSYRAPHQAASPRCLCGRAAPLCSGINQLQKKKTKNQ